MLVAFVWELTKKKSICPWADSRVVQGIEAELQAELSGAEHQILSKDWAKRLDAFEHPSAHQAVAAANVVARHALTAREAGAAGGATVVVGEVTHLTHSLSHPHALSRTLSRTLTNAHSLAFTHSLTLTQGSDATGLETADGKTKSRMGLEAELAAQLAGKVRESLLNL